MIIVSQSLLGIYGEGEEVCECGEDLPYKCMQGVVRLLSATYEGDNKSLSC